LAQQALLDACLLRPSDSALQLLLLAYGAS